MKGNMSAQIAGDGGQEKGDGDSGKGRVMSNGVHGAWLKASPRCTGPEEDHTSSRVQAGSSAVRYPNRLAMRLSGMSGRLIKVCHGQLDGSSVTIKSYILVHEVSYQRRTEEVTYSLPRNSCKAYAPYAVLTTYIPGMSIIR